MNLNTRENQLTAAVMQYLTLKGWDCWRINSGMLWSRNGRRPVACVKRADGEPFRGFSDILSVVPISGRIMAIETKRPGIRDVCAAGQLTKDQWYFICAIQDRGGVALLLYDLADLEVAVEHLTADPHARLDWRGRLHGEKYPRRGEGVT